MVRRQEISVACVAAVVVTKNMIGAVRPKPLRSSSGLRKLNA